MYKNIFKPIINYFCEMAPSDHLDNIYCKYICNVTTLLKIKSLKCQMLLIMADQSSTGT